MSSAGDAPPRYVIGAALAGKRRFSADGAATLRSLSACAPTKKCGRAASFFRPRRKSRKQSFIYINGTLLCINESLLCINETLLCIFPAASETFLPAFETFVSRLQSFCRPFLTLCRLFPELFCPLSKLLPAAPDTFAGTCSEMRASYEKERPCCRRYAPSVGRDAPSAGACGLCGFLRKRRWRDAVPRSLARRRRETCAPPFTDDIGGRCAAVGRKTAAIGCG